ncbi:NRDE family protein [Roseibacillus persicicus]|uniref:NRDE family protein n=1 Tax=Roseibacillus persicicus TaxID=454148 RepID=UPI00280E9516|nr:NRDE family protein [Roseibacillus persicicus]MDQ8189410.1 NRDE family protein [Roseibacillus persicicus]
MCTLTWRDERNALEVFFNRDELKTRTRAEPPRCHLSEKGTRYLSPIDPDAGGTWMLANGHGIVICLLNRWNEESTLHYQKSRGSVVTELADCPTLVDLAQILPNNSQGAKPFDLIAFANGQVRGFSWKGKELTAFEPRMPLTSSSYQFEEVKTAREQAFAHAKRLEDFQSSKHGSSSAYTVRMNRPDAQTWSRSHLTITAAEISWDYWEEFPDLAQEPTLHQTSLRLERGHSCP